METEKSVAVTESEDLGTRCAEEVLSNGGKEINVMIREQLKKSPTA